MILNMFILTAAQRTTAMGFNNSNVAVNPRAVSGTSPGVGLNLNDNATGVAAGAAVALSGKYVTNSRILNDPDYQTYAPAMLAYLATMPWAAVETETIFAPVQD